MDPANQTKNKEEDLHAKLGSREIKDKYKLTLILRLLQLAQPERDLRCDRREAMRAAAEGDCILVALLLSCHYRRSCRMPEPDMARLTKRMIVCGS